MTKGYTGQNGTVKLHAEDEKAAAHHGHWQWHGNLNGGSNLLWQRLGEFQNNKQIQIGFISGYASLLDCDFCSPRLSNYDYSTVRASPVETALMNLEERGCELVGHAMITFLCC